MPGIRRVMADNPGPFTFKGTMSYIVGRGKVAIVDPGSGRRAPYRRVARRRAQRDGDGDLRHPHPPRSFAGGAGDQGGDRRHRLCRRPAPRRAAAAYRRTQSARFQRRPRLPPRRRAQGRRGRFRRRLDHRSGDDARPHRQSHGLCVQGEQRAVRRRSCDGLGHLDCGAARRRHERLHGFAATSSPNAARRSISPATAPRSATPRASSTTTSCIARRARRRSCIGWRKAKPTFRRSCARSISASIRA